MQHNAPSFAAQLESIGFFPLAREALATIQVNLGPRCNMSCQHCHVDAGPHRTEQMGLRTIDRLVRLAEASPSVQTVDLTGGAPELNPHFRSLVQRMRALGKKVLDRCNLTVLSEPGMEWLADFLAQQQVQIVASMPCYLEHNVDKQRGSGSYHRCVDALRRLNLAGYGTNPALQLDLVYNPGGPFLPPPQGALESDYKRELRAQHGVVFNHLLTITNMPINRFARKLDREGTREAYMRLLVDSFNPAIVQTVMCRTLVSVGWDGRLYDCDFNQILELPLGADDISTIFDLDSFEPLTLRPIATGTHCFGCTAGAGSSCGGALE